MKKIIVKEYLKFVACCEQLKFTSFAPAYSTGYWNVFQHNDQLEKFLIENEISYTITEKSITH